VGEQSPMRVELIDLAALLIDSELAMENRRDHLFRLSINPNTVFFADELFTFSVKPDDLQSVHNKIPVIIDRQSFDTAFGQIKNKAVTFNLTLEFVHKLKSLSEQQFSADHDEAVKIEDTYKKGLHKEANFQALGLRNLIRREAGIIKFVLTYDCS
jgi:hypothetical protein